LDPRGGLNAAAYNQASTKRKGGKMAGGVLTAAPEFTKQTYDDVTERCSGTPRPCGKTRRRKG
jgi:hypothetical protein